uniref:GDSL esterase/lipase n=1 Tax=Aegilops tauschii subsp. strangulata TaxID=200361 RepID=A0A453T2E5_AEGTS
MKLLPAALGLVLLLLLVLNPNGVEARPAPAGGHQKKASSATFFVFGDDFADNGNLPLTKPVTEMSRQWAYPYGSNYVDADGFPRPNTPSGRFSNYKIQSDFIATMLGLEEAPPAHARTADKTCDPINAYIGKVTKEIAANVDELLKLGVTKVLVNNLHPIGCTPSHTRTNNYTTCDMFGNLGASIHNDNLKQVMTSKKNVYIVDVYTAFASIVDHAAGKGSDLSKQFKRKLSPCCESLNSKGYCGQQNESSAELLYTVCDKSSKIFYWDDMHPTHAGWEAVMKQLEKPLREFVN